MNNTLVDLNNYLFESIERQNDETLSDQEFEKELRRSEAVGKIAKNIIDNSSLLLNAHKVANGDGKISIGSELPMFGADNK